MPHYALKNLKMPVTVNVIMPKGESQINNIAIAMKRRIITGVPGIAFEPHKTIELVHFVNINDYKKAIESIFLMAQFPPLPPGKKQIESFHSFYPGFETCSYVDSFSDLTIALLPRESAGQFMEQLKQSEDVFATLQTIADSFSNPLTCDIDGHFEMGLMTLLKVRLPGLEFEELTHFQPLTLNKAEKVELTWHHSTSDQKQQQTDSKSSLLPSPPTVMLNVFGKGGSAATQRILDDVKQRFPDIKFSGFLTTSAGDAHDLLLKQVQGYLAEKPAADFKPLVEAINKKDYSQALRRICNYTVHQVAVDLAALLLAQKEKLTIKINEKNKENKSAYDYANSRGNKVLCELLKNHGAIPSAETVLTPASLSSPAGR